MGQWQSFLPAALEADAQWGAHQPRQTAKNPVLVEYENRIVSTQQRQEPPQVMQSGIDQDTFVEGNDAVQVRVAVQRRLRGLADQIAEVRLRQMGAQLSNERGGHQHIAQCADFPEQYLHCLCAGAVNMKDFRYRSWFPAFALTEISETRRYMLGLDGIDRSSPRPCWEEALIVAVQLTAGRDRSWRLCRQSTQGRRESSFPQSQSHRCA